jgi:ubiquinol-cytochrome c reductase cytochrome c1 subunit
MNMNNQNWISGVLCAIAIVVGSVSYAVQASEEVTLKTVNNDLCDKASLQRGAQLYMNFCAGCHSLQFMRFKEMAKDLGIKDENGLVLEQLVNDNLNFISDKINQPILTAAPRKDQEKWFGVAPPDLSLVTRSRGKNWVYTYLLSFYADPKRPWGVNNVIFPDVAMPNVLQGLQGTQEAVFTTVTLMDEQNNPYDKQIIHELKAQSAGTLSDKAFNQAIVDLVNFLDYVGEPHKLERERIGVWVLLFLVIFTLFAYLLKREYWKDVH